jgi:hypothetical protein
LGREDQTRKTQRKTTGEERKRREEVKRGVQRENEEAQRAADGACGCRNRSEGPWRKEGKASATGRRVHGEYATRKKR